MPERGIRMLAEERAFLRGAILDDRIDGVRQLRDELEGDLRRAQTRLHVLADALDFGAKWRPGAAKVGRRAEDRLDSAAGELAGARARFDRVASLLARLLKARSALGGS